MAEEEMMGQKGFVPPEEKKPWKSSLITFITLLLFGSAPLLSFIILIPLTKDDLIKFIGACIISILALTLLGLANAKISGKSFIFSVLKTVLNDVIAAAVAYSNGWTLQQWLAG